MIELKENKNLKEDFKRHIDRINELTNRMDKAIRILNSAKNHYDNDKTNWAIERTLRVLKGIDYDLCCKELKKKKPQRR